jgi:hypothetical protein
MSKTITSSQLLGEIGEAAGLAVLYWERGDSMPARRSATRPAYTEGVIRRLANANNVTVVVSSNDVFAEHITRLSGDDVAFDAVENTIVALQRAGVLSRTQAVRLQARYLRESRP